MTFAFYLGAGNIIFPPLAGFMAGEHLLAAMCGFLLTAVGLPLEGVALIAGIDRILDMARTTVNVSGDILVSVLIARSENELDLATYHDASAGEDIEFPPR